jgi:hypothetical protein
MGIDRVRWVETEGNGQRQKEMGIDRVRWVETEGDGWRERRWRARRAET